MERVTGIGGVFLRGGDSDALRAWYVANLGISLEEWGGSVFQAESGDVTVWSIFAGDTEYWPQAQQVMVNYRVRDLDAMLAQLRAAGAEVDDKVEENGARPLRLGRRPGGEPLRALAADRRPRS